MTRRTIIIELCRCTRNLKLRIVKVINFCLPHYTKSQFLFSSNPKSLMCDFSLQKPLNLRQVCSWTSSGYFSMSVAEWVRLTGAESAFPSNLFVTFPVEALYRAFHRHSISRDQFSNLFWSATRVTVETALRDPALSRVKRCTIIINLDCVLVIVCWNIVCVPRCIQWGNGALLLLVWVYY